MEAVEFEGFGKIPRQRNVLTIVTEKIDGTNAQIYVPADPSQPVLAGSRNKWITPGKTTDNFGFAAFVEQHAEVFRRLGPGRHFGEWWGAGIGRRYGLTDRRLSLFNTERYADGLPQGLPESVGLVPVLYRGAFSREDIDRVTADLYANGSVAVPGWSKPEGVVVVVGGLRWKVTDNNDQHKGTPASERE